MTRHSVVVLAAIRCLPAIAAAQIDKRTAADAAAEFFAKQLMNTP